MKKGLTVMVIDNETNEKILNGPYEPGFLGVSSDGEVRADYYLKKHLQKYDRAQTERLTALLVQILEEYPELGMLGTYVDTKMDKEASEEEAE